MEAETRESGRHIIHNDWKGLNKDEQKFQMINFACRLFFELHRAIGTDPNSPMTSNNFQMLSQIQFRGPWFRMLFQELHKLAASRVKIKS